ncbi:MAG: type IV secretory system conjugative DNA transfer family protein [Lachnospiraceae bacterium]|nr:type IV secretory system conjugative DNA transfer family protein [Lachnospiraceae bacterium]
MIPRKNLILADNQYYSLDCYKTRLNNNVLVVGASGSGKTRSIVEPNLRQACGSYIISDPKGNLCRKYRDYLEKRGYVVKMVDFTHPQRSEGYNFFRYIRSTQDIVKAAHMLMYDERSRNARDPFWDQAAELLLSSLIAYLYLFRPVREQNLRNVMKLLDVAGVAECNVDAKTIMDRLMDDVRENYPGNFACRQYDKVRQSAGRTMRSILISVSAKIGGYDFPEMEHMMGGESLDFTEIGRRKTAVFVVVSDTDRSLDGLADLFFTQAMNELCSYADDHCSDSRLPVDVRFIMDDFATNCRIGEFPRMISSIRSRGISTMLMIQSEAQLAASYGEDGRTIMGNCDTYVYLGGNDVDTAQAVARRCDLPVKRILNMPVGTNWIFRRGQEPINGKNFPLEKMEKEMKEEGYRQSDLGRA